MGKILKKRILFFIGSLRSGGKERRMIELLTYLKHRGEYELLLILAFNKIDYPVIYKLGVNLKVINKKSNYKDPALFYKMYKICKEFDPHIIHTWGNMQTTYMMPVAKICKIPIITSQVTSAKPNRERYSFSEITKRINFKLSNIVTSNSFAGLSKYNVPENGKYRVIYNGVNMERFINLPVPDEIKNKFNLTTKYAIVMAASFSENKDWDKYLEICKLISNIRDDITCYAAGDGINLLKIKNKAKNENITNTRFTGKISNVEELISICDIGVLLTNSKVHGEGISNAILEYMAFGKPVIANDAGGTKEIVENNKSGYLVSNESNQEIANMVMYLMDNPEHRQRFGKRGAMIIQERFSLERMGASFEDIYHEVLSSEYK